MSIARWYEIEKTIFCMVMLTVLATVSEFARVTGYRPLGASGNCQSH
jgi:hypothetical protein